MRNKGLDVVKGIGIILVILGHNTNDLHSWIYTFHMPLFFMLAGIFHKSSETFIAFFKKKWKSLMIPYFTFAIMLFIFWLFIGRYFGESAIQKTPIRECLIGILYSVDKIKGFSSMEFGSYIWFLPCLFIMSNIFYFLENKNKKKVFLIWIILFIFSEISQIYLPIILPWNIQRACRDLIFYILGYYLSDYFKDNNTKQQFWRGVIFLGINIFIYFILKNKNVIFFKEVNYLLGGFFGSIGTIEVFRGISKNKILEFLGKNTLVLFAFHGRANSVIKFIFIILLNKQMMEGSIIFDIVKMSAQIIICLPLVYIFNKYLPFLIGKKGVK